MPFPYLFEALVGDWGREPEPFKSMKEDVAGKVVNIEENELHRRVREFGYSEILTTNYDYMLEGREFAGKGGGDTTNLFRARQVAGERGKWLRVWHLHGEACAPESIVLGLEHYIRCVDQIGDYMSGMPPQRSKVQKQKWSTKRARSPRVQKATVRNRTWVNPNRQAWLDVFMESEVHVVGLTLGPEELTLWRALMLRRYWCQDNAKRRRCRLLELKKPPPIHYYAIKPELMSDFAEQTTADAHHRLLKQLGVDVVEIACTKFADTTEPDYKAFYSEALERIESKANGMCAP